MVAGPMPKRGRAITATVWRRQRGRAASGWRQALAPTARRTEKAEFRDRSGLTADDTRQYLQRSIAAEGKVAGLANLDARHQGRQPRDATSL